MERIRIMACTYSCVERVYRAYVYRRIRIMTMARTYLCVERVCRAYVYRRIRIMTMARTYLCVERVYRAYVYGAYLLVRRHCHLARHPRDSEREGLLGLTARDR
jgi:hypothetical protein